MTTPENVKLLAEEYRTLLKDTLKVEEGYSSNDAEKIKRLLVQEGEWTPLAAEHLVAIANNYGSFMLRNALALSLALGIEDGELDF
jgi:hypothetical protein